MSIQERDYCFEVNVPATATPSEAFNIGWAHGREHQERETEMRFWRALDREDFAYVPSDMWEAVERLARANEPHELAYVQFSDCGQHIRKWSRSPFEGARKCRIALPQEV